MSGLVEPTATPVSQDDLLPLAEVELHVQEELFMNWFRFKNNISFELEREET